MNRHHAASGARRPLGRSQRSNQPAKFGAQAHQHQIQDWRELAQAGAYDAAYRALKSPTGPRAKHPSRPPRPLHNSCRTENSCWPPMRPVCRSPSRRFALPGHVPDANPADPSVDTVRFTRAKTLLALGRCAQAALAFEQCIGGPMAQDAFRRAIETHLACDQENRARELARQFLTRYPSASYAPEARRLVDAATDTP